MKKMLIIIASIWLVLGVNYGASAWIYVPDQGDTGWKSYTYSDCQKFFPIGGIKKFTIKISKN